MIDVNFKYHKDRITYKLKPTDTIKNIREKLSIDLGQLPKAVHLCFNDEVLEDEQILQDILSDESKEPIDIHCDDDLSSDDDDESDDDNPAFELNPQSEFEIPSYTPPNFDENVKKLMEIVPGRQPPDIYSRALRLAFFNVSRAAEYLLSGDELPERPTILPFTDSSGIQYNPIPDKSQSPILNKLSEDEIKAFQRVMNKTNANYSIAIQVFMATDKNEEQSIEILKNE